MKKGEKFKLPPETLALYRSMLPYGAQKKIAAQIGVREASVSYFLAGKMHSQRIEEGILSYIADARATRQAQLKKAGLL